jgi:four helix bundle protein
MADRLSACRRVGVSACRRVGVSACRRVGVDDFSDLMRYSMGTMPMVKHFRELDVYKGAMSLVMEIFALSKQFPPDERFTLTDQIRRSSRSLCANIAEAWRKRRYEAAFVAKLNDAETEASETQVHLEIALNHEYIDRETFEALDDKCDKIISQVVKMIDQADRWIIEAAHIKRRSTR